MQDDTNLWNGVVMWCLARGLCGVLSGLGLPSLVCGVGSGLVLRFADWEAPLVPQAKHKLFPVCVLVEFFQQPLCCLCDICSLVPFLGLGAFWLCHF